MEIDGYGVVNRYIHDSNEINNLLKNIIKVFAGFNYL